MSQCEGLRKVNVEVLVLVGVVVARFVVVQYAKDSSSWSEVTTGRYI